MDHIFDSFYLMIGETFMFDNRYGPSHMSASSNLVHAHAMLQTKDPLCLKGKSYEKRVIVLQLDLKRERAHVEITRFRT